MARRHLLRRRLTATARAWRCCSRGARGSLPRDSNGATPLHKLAMGLWSGGGGEAAGAGGGLVKCATLLLEAGAPADATDSKRRTPLDYVVDPVLAAARGAATTEALRALLVAPPAAKRPRREQAVKEEEENEVPPPPRPHVEFAEPLAVPAPEETVQVAPSVAQSTPPSPPPSEPPPMMPHLKLPLVSVVSRCSTLRMMERGAIETTVPVSRLHSLCHFDTSIYTKLRNLL